MLLVRLKPAAHRILSQALYHWATTHLIRCLKCSVELVNNVNPDQPATQAGTQADLSPGVNTGKSV